MSWGAILTCYPNRPTGIIGATVYHLRRSFPDCEPIIVYDDDTPRGFEGCTEIVAETSKAHPDHFHYNGNNNVSYAFNVGLNEAAKRHSHLIILCSDVIISPATRQLAKYWETGNFKERCIVTPSVVNTDTGNLLCAPNRIFPMPWCLMAETDDVVDCGGWDEEFMNGIAYEDNDFVGRLAVQVGHVYISGINRVYHQSHPETWFGDKNVGVMGNFTNRAYCLEKWGKCLPFDSEENTHYLSPLKITPAWESNLGIMLKVTRSLG